MAVDKWGSAKEAKMLRAAIRDRLHREVRLNLEIWKLFEKNAQPDAALADLLSVAAFDEICSLNLPLWALLDGNAVLPMSVKDFLQQKDRAQPNGNFVRWTADIHTETDLVERIWHRLRVIKARHSLDGSLGDCAYLMHLHRAMDQHLLDCRTRAQA